MNWNSVAMLPRKSVGGHFCKAACGSGLSEEVAASGFLGNGQSSEHLLCVRPWHEGKRTQNRNRFSTLNEYIISQGYMCTHTCSEGPVQGGKSIEPGFDSQAFHIPVM